MQTSIALFVLAAATAQAGGPSPEIPFEKHTLDLGRSEACAFADINADGKLDIVSGENWYAAPNWTKRKHRDILFWNNYIDDFSDLPIDADSDGDIDIVSVGWGQKKVAWYENPGSGHANWKEHPIDSGMPVEFAFLVDLDNDGKKEEVLPQFGGKEGYTAWYELSGNGKWVARRVSNKLFGHGIGAGDVNGDGRNDVLTPKGWLEAPPDPTQTPWKLHEEYSFDQHTGFLFTHDIDGDGMNDIITSAAHDYGIYWLKQGKGPNGARTWERETIDDAWSQAHAMTMVDLTGDGKPELLTGKRFYAHNGHDAGGREPLGVYWYERVETERGFVWARHTIDYGGRTGGGMQIPAADLDGDGDIDFAVAGKGGLFLFENKTKM